MTQGIIEDQEKNKEKQVNVIFEDDDDFEEFEITNVQNDGGMDVDMDGAADVRQVW